MAEKIQESIDSIERMRQRLYEYRDRIDREIEEADANKDEEQFKHFTDTKSNIDDMLGNLRSTKTDLESSVLLDEVNESLVEALATVKRTKKHTSKRKTQKSIDALAKTIEKMQEITEKLDTNMDDAVIHDDMELCEKLVHAKVDLCKNIERLQELKHRIEADVDGQGADDD